MEERDRILELGMVYAASRSKLRCSMVVVASAVCDERHDERAMRPLLITAATTRCLCLRRCRRVCRCILGMVPQHEQ